jgi:hypothetical protein
MNAVRVMVNPGVCGFKTVIMVTSTDNRHAFIELKTECPNLEPLEAELEEADAYKECFAPVGKSGIYESASRYCKHAGCPVPAAIVKGVEACCGLALPRDVTIEISKYAPEAGA